VHEGQACLSGKEATAYGRLWVLQAEEKDGPPLADAHSAGDIQDERRLTQARPTDDEHELAGKERPTKCI